MYFQQPMNPFGYNPNQVYINRPVAKNTQPLSQDVINSLRNQNEQLDWKVDQIDIHKSICTHKDGHGNMTLTLDPNDGYLCCAICGERFQLFEGDVDEVKQVVEKMNNILQTCKTFYLDAPESFAAAYYQFMPLMKKLPTLWNRAYNNWMQYNGADPVATMNTAYSANGFQMLGQLTGNPVYGTYGYQQPMGMPMGYPQQPMAPQQQMMYPQQTAQQPMMGAQMPQQVPQQMAYQQPAYQQPVMPNMGVAPAVNPLAYGTPAAAPMPGTIPAPQQPAMAPQPTAPVAAQPMAEAPAANGDVVQSQTFNV